LAAHGAERLDEAFDAEGLRMRVRLPADRVDALAAQLRDATRNRARIGDNG
jgi:putative IMPACT (imprinted ancient) family translation regulator